MASRLPVPILAHSRFGPWARLAATLFLAALAVLGAGRGAGAEGVGRTAADPVEFIEDRGEDHGALRQARFDPRMNQADSPDRQAGRGEPAAPLADRVLDRGRALLDRYGSEQLLAAVGVGALVQVVCMVLVRLVGTIFRLASRVLAWSSGVAVALYVLNGPATLPVSVDGVTGWLGRLADLVDLVNRVA